MRTTARPSPTKTHAMRPTARPSPAKTYAILAATLGFVSLMGLVFVLGLTRQPKPVHAEALGLLDPVVMAKTYDANRKLANKTYIGQKGYVRLTVQEKATAMGGGRALVGKSVRCIMREGMSLPSIGQKGPASWDGIEVGNVVLVRGECKGFSTLDGPAYALFEGCEVVALGYAEAERFLNQIGEPTR